MKLSRSIAALIAGTIGLGALVAGPALLTAQETAEAPAPAAKNYAFPEAGTTKVIDEEEIARIIATHGSELLVVNFWATWCGPCVEELPYFVNLAKKYDPAKVRVVGFSVDLVKDVESKVVPFLKKNEIPFSNVVLFVSDQQAVIELMSAEWTGEVPATFFFDADGKKVAEILGATEEEPLFKLTEEVHRKAAPPEDK